MKSWQKPVAIIGSLTWVAVIFNGKTLLAYNSDLITGLTSGYLLVFLVAYVGHMIWDTPVGFIRSFVNSDNVLENLHAGFLLTFMLLIASTVFFITLIGWTTWQFNVGAMIATFVVNQGLVPFIKAYDRSVDF